MVDEQLRCLNPIRGLPIATVEDLRQMRDSAHLKLKEKRGRVKEKIPFVVIHFT